MALITGTPPRPMPLEGAPPSPPAMQAQPQPLPVGPPGPQGPPDVGGSPQIFQIGLQIGADIAQRLDLLAQTFPQLATLTAMMQTQLKAGLRSALQQGSVMPESGSAMPPMAGPPAMMAPPSGRPMTEVGG